MRTVILAFLLTILPLPLRALNTSEVLGLVAMPLAVAAVSEATGVPAAELGQVVASLNQASVPPAEFVQVIRYVPVALVVEEERPRFVEFVRTQVDQGVTGKACGHRFDPGKWLTQALFPRGRQPGRPGPRR